MKVAWDRMANENRLKELSIYLTENILDTGQFKCKNYNDCRSSLTNRDFYEGQLHHLGKYYDLVINGEPQRLAVIGQEYGYSYQRISLDSRYKMIMGCGLDLRFKADGIHKVRNPHMKGTTNLLRLVYGIPLGTDHEEEYIQLDDRSIHIFDTFALVNYFLCSALKSGTTNGRPTRIMHYNCLEHFSNVLKILEPTIIVIQGKRDLDYIKQAFDSITHITEVMYQAKLNGQEVKIAAFTHPSAQGSLNWGRNDHTPYLLETVLPAISSIQNRTSMNSRSILKKKVQADRRIIMQKSGVKKSFGICSKIADHYYNHIEYREGSGTQFVVDEIEKLCKKGIQNVSKDQLELIVKKIQPKYTKRVIHVLNWGKRLGVLTKQNKDFIIEPS